MRATSKHISGISLISHARGTMTWHRGSTTQWLCLQVARQGQVSNLDQQHALHGMRLAASTAMLGQNKSSQQ
jgi:hypothetical protein